MRREADALGLMCIHYNQPKHEEPEPERERYRSRRSSSRSGSWQSAWPLGGVKRTSLRRRPMTAS